MGELRLFYAPKKKRERFLMQKQKGEKMGAGMRSSKRKELFKREIKTRFSAKRIALMAVFVALSFVVSFLEVPLFPSAPFLKLDFGNIFILLIGFLLGPVEGVFVCLLKETLRMIGSSSGGVGEIANVLVTCSYILLPAILYQKHKGLKNVLPNLALACLIGTSVALITNRFINFPLYVGEGANEMFKKLFWIIVAFNLIKTAAISILTVLLYKRLSTALKRIKI